MFKYIQLSALVSISFFILAVIKYPVRKLFPKTKLYIFLRKAHRLFAILSLTFAIVHGLLVLQTGFITFIAILLFISLCCLIFMGIYKTYINKKMKYRVFIGIHKLFALLTMILIILHFLDMRGIL